MVAGRLFAAVLILQAVALGGGCDVSRPAGAPPGSYTPAKLNVTAGGASGPVDGAAVRPEFFSAAGIRPMLGRLFIPSEYAADGSAVVILSRQYWDLRFQSRPDIIGTAIEVDGRPRVIVGIGPPEFKPDGAGLLWIPRSD